MKRSQINAKIKETLRLLDEYKIDLPPFANFTPEEWAEKGEEYNEVRDNMLGWDLTDYGGDDFDKLGLLLITLRNGNHDNPRYKKPYAEKILVVQEGQKTPMHFHWSKMEDIINRGGGILCMQVYNSDENGNLSNTDVEINSDGRHYTVPAGTVLRFKPGESLSIQQGLYHSFWAEGGTCLVFEVSMVNDDKNDNRYYDKVGRFPEIEEDEKPFRLLCTEYN